MSVISIIWGMEEEVAAAAAAAAISLFVNASIIFGNLFGYI
jgi:hypothetical protein